ncbi:MAG TPA: 5-oxoprolinase subunit PxpA [Vicinamibacterales bacterium]|nr:5-oxoprolinase subunit PxpA [Vicinamibacterales bacterium]
MYPPPVRVDINCDMGESFGRWELGADAAVMPHISSANIACGGHAGDPAVMRRTLRLAKEHGVAAGAHPGFADLAGFGRREIPIAGQEAGDLVLWQLGGLEAIARSEGVRLRHVKAHGALYNMAARDAALAEAIAAAVAQFDRTLVFFGLAGSGMLDAGRRAGLDVAAEGFADRAYEPDGSLTPRSTAGAVIHDVDAVVARAVRMVRESRVTARNGADVPLRIDTICVHGDTPGAPALARALREGLQARGVRIVPAGSAPSPA